MNRLEVATADHAIELAPRLREADLAELVAVTPLDAETALLMTIGLSTWAYAWYYGDTLVGLGGVSPGDVPGLGQPWMVGSDELRLHKDYFLSQTAVLIEKMHETYPRLSNFVAVGNYPAINWLRAAGFEIHPPVPYGLRGELFHPFTKEKPPCAGP